MIVLILDDQQYRLDSFYAMFRMVKPDAAVKGLKEAWAVNRHLSSVVYDYVFLDHDLGGETYVDSDRDDTGMGVVRHIINNLDPSTVRTRFIIHSMNGPAAREMGLKLHDAGFNAVIAPFNRLLDLGSEGYLESIDDLCGSGQS